MSRARNAFLNGMGGIGCLLRQVIDSGYSEVEPFLNGVTVQEPLVCVPDNTRPQRALKPNWNRVPLARVDSSKHFIKILKSQPVWSQLRSKNRLVEVVTRIFLKVFGTF